MPVEPQPEAEGGPRGLRLTVALEPLAEPGVGEDGAPEGEEEVHLRESEFTSVLDRETLHFGDNEYFR